MTSLERLDCSHNALTDLDVSTCTSLTHLDCYNNQLITLDLSPCTALESSSVWGQYRDVAVNDSNRIRLPDLVRSNGGDMDRVTPCVNVRDKSTYTDSVIHFFHPEASFTYRYNTGKGSMSVYLHPSTFSDLAVVAIDEEHFPDFNFRRYVQENHDANQNGILETTESYCVDNVSQQVDEMGLVRYPSDYSEMFGGVLGLDVSGWGIADLSGIEYFSGLVALNCQDGVLESLDLRGCPDLRYIDCSGNRGLSRIELAHDSLLLDLDCNRTALDLKPLLPRWKNLEELDCRDMQLMELDLGGNPRLSFLNCSNNRIDSLSLVGSGMEELYCNENDIRTIEMGTDTLRSLRDLYCNFNRLAELDLSLLPNLEKIGFVHNGLACMDLSQNDWLESVYRNNTDEEAKDEDSTANYHAVSLPDGGRKVALSSIPGLESSRMGKLYGGSIRGDSLTFIQDTVSYYYYYGNPDSDIPAGGYFFLYLMEGNPIRIDGTHFPDLAFRAYVSEHLDSSANGYLDGGEAGIKALDVSGLGIRDLRGIGYFSELESLDCSDNALTSLDLSGNPALQDLNAEGNRLDVTLDANHGFDLSTLPGFDAGKASDWTGGQVEGTYLRFVQDEVSYAYETGYQGSAELPEVRFLLFAADREEGIAIDEAHFPDEAFRTYVAENLDSSANGYLESKEAGIKALDVSGLGIRDLKGIEHFTSLESLDCSDNQLSSLDLSLNTKLTELDATGNVLKVSLDDFNRLDFSLLPGFDPTKASDWTGARVVNPRLQFLQAEVSYAYETGYQGEAELPEVRFRLDAGNGEAEIAVSEANFPDAVFRSHVSGQIDRSGNDSLDIVERGNVRVLEVPSMGIQDLRGIGYFNKLTRLDCSNNELTSLDLSGNPALQILNAENNQLDITLDASNGFDLSLLPGFDLAKASGWEGGIRLGNILTFNQREVTYAYATGYSGSTEDESLPSVRFSLRADREPGVANESMEAKPQGKVYAKEHVIHTEGIEGEISVFTPSGMLLYQGHGKEIPVRNDGLYIVRSGQQVWKVLVL